MGNATEIGRTHLKYLQSRSSTTKYIMRGSPGNFRFERGVSEGSYIVDTYGFRSEGEEVKTVTNQVMRKIVLY